jgi:mannosyl-3-phosphoglycerate synthase
MRLTRPTRSRTFGLLHIAEEAQVLELDSYGPTGTEKDKNGGETVGFSRETLDRVLSQTVIIVPCKDEELGVIRGVISAIPAPCLVILVSNCERGGVHDEYLQQVEMLRTFGGYRRQILAIHQKDIGAAAALRASGMAELLDPTDGTVRNGKGEGMLLAIALAATFSPERRYIGFVDADNFHGASVNEYCRAFAAGFAMSPETEHCMVRLRWASKPKMRGGKVDFVPEGRCSRIVNSWLNKLLVPSTKHCNGTKNTDSKPFVTTGNAGEHAMTMDLALKLRMAAGYAIEPFHYIDVLARGHLSAGINGPNGARTTKSANGGTKKTAQPGPLQKPVRVLQIRTLNPHFHRSSDDEHIRRMWASGLGSIYHGLAPYHAMPGSPASSTISDLRRDMHAFAVENRGIDDATGELPRPRVYPAMEDADLNKFREVLEASVAKGSLTAVGFGQLRG